jgi:hypothetical protein
MASMKIKTLVAGSLFAIGALQAAYEPAIVSFDLNGLRIKINTRTSWDKLSIEQTAELTALEQTLATTTDATTAYAAVDGLVHKGYKVNFKFKDVTKTKAAKPAIFKPVSVIFTKQLGNEVYSYKVVTHVAVENFENSAVSKAITEAGDAFLKTAATTIEAFACFQNLVFEYGCKLKIKRAKN